MILLAVERIHPEHPDRPGMTTADRRPQRFRGVFQNGNAASVAQLLDCGHVRRLAVQVHDHNGFRVMVFEGPLQCRRRHVPALRLAIDEHRRGAFVAYGIATRRKRQVRAENDVAPLHAKRLETQVQGCGSRVQCKGRTRPDIAGDHVFELVNIGP